MRSGGNGLGPTNAGSHSQHGGYLLRGSSRQQRCFLCTSCPGAPCQKRQTPAELSIAWLICLLPVSLWLQTLAMCMAGRLHLQPQSCCKQMERGWCGWVVGGTAGNRRGCASRWSQTGKDKKTSGVFSLAHCQRCKKTRDGGSPLQLMFLFILCE